MKKSSINEIVILYNPNSTGDSRRNARQLRDDLKSAEFPHPITLIGTRYRKHAEKIAAEYASKNKRVLIISSSGDGGYHELINGVLAQNHTKVIVGLLPSGNANDHYHAMSKGSIVEQIINDEPRSVDVIQVTSRIKGKKWVRYAHSYVGVGITPTIARQLNKKELNVFNEKIILLKELFIFKSVKILQAGNVRNISSIICANIPRMSKDLKVARDSSPNDGKFEVTVVERSTRGTIFAALIKSVTVGMKENKSVSEYSFSSIKQLSIQLDGELYSIDPESKVDIQIVEQRLKVFI